MGTPRSPLPLPRLTRRRRKPVPYGPYRPGDTYVFYRGGHRTDHVTYIGRNAIGMHQFIDHKTGDTWTGYNPPVQRTVQRTDQRFSVKR